MNLYRISNNSNDDEILILSNSLEKAIEHIPQMYHQNGDNNPIVLDYFGLLNCNITLPAFTKKYWIEIFDQDGPVLSVYSGDRSMYGGFGLNQQFIDLMKNKYQIKYDVSSYIPNELKQMAKQNLIADTLVLCHGRQGRKILNLDYKKAWFVDPLEKQQADIAIGYEDIPLNLLPKFKYVMQIFCPGGFDVVYLIDIFEFAYKVLVNGGILIIPFDQDRQIFEQLNNYATTHGWRLLNGTFKLELENFTKPALHFQKI